MFCHCKHTQVTRSMFSSSNWRNKSNKSRLEGRDKREHNQYLQETRSFSRIKIKSQRQMPSMMKRNEMLACDRVKSTTATTATKASMAPNSCKSQRTRRRLEPRRQHCDIRKGTSLKINASWFPQLCQLICALQLATICFTSISSTFNQNQHLNLPSIIQVGGAVQHQQQTSSPQLDMLNIQQMMAQQLQVFNGNDSQQMEANHFKLLELIDENTLLVGARNVLYNLSLSTMREQRRLVWSSSESDMAFCRLKGKSADQCQNYIRVAKVLDSGVLFVCGTNSYSPICRKYAIEAEGYEQLSEMPGEGTCPFQENQNVTSTFTDGQLYSATTAQFNGVDALIHRQPLRTEQFNPKQLNSPNFVNSFRYGDHVYFLFREVAIEHINCGKTIYSRIGRVCVNDQGGSTTSLNRQRWTSFVKTRLNCSIPGEFPFHFDEIQASTHVLSSAYHQASPLSGNSFSTATSAGPQSDLLYAVFTTPQNSIGGSAVCAYRMADILAAFQGPFKSQADSQAMWLPVPESRVPQAPRPGSCANDSKRLPEEHINFIRDNPLMDTAVEPIWSQPLITMASINFRFTQIAVDAQVETQLVPGAPIMRTDVIFVATDDGRVFKLINSYHLRASSQAHRVMANGNGVINQSLQMVPASHQMKPFSQAQLQPPTPYKQEPVVDVSAFTMVIEELHLFDARTPIMSMMVHYTQHVLSAQTKSPSSAGKLIVMSGKQIKAIPLSRCERALSCNDCLALIDPYCAWDLEQQACLSTGRSQALVNTLTTGPIHRAATPNWFPANSFPSKLNGNNHTIGWWMSCPMSNHIDSQPIQPLQQVGAPVRSLFSSHLQVPSRFDYQSGHHLSRTSLISVPQMAATPPNQPANPMRQAQQPASECSTFCGGIYTPNSAFMGGSSLTSDPSFSTCAELFAGQSNSLFLQSSLQQQHQNLYTSENVLLVVIICAVLAMLLGLLFGFALGKNARLKNESSICSSTFDETNLYMASTGSHCHPVFAAPLSQQTSTAARLANHPAFTGASNGYALGPTGSHRVGGTNQLFDASQCLLVAAASDHSSGIGSSTYANQQQQALINQHLVHQNNSPASIRTGALPPIPVSQPPQQHQQQQLTPNSQNGSTGLASSTASSSTMTANDQQQQQQFYLNQQQHMNSNNNKHQRSFTNGSNGSTGKAAIVANQTTNQQQQQQQNFQAQQAANKIYL